MMEALIAKLESAPVGSRELELGIAVALDWHEDSISIRAFIEKFPDGTVLHWGFPKWTRSLEAALTLVPEGCVIELCQSCPSRADDTWWDAYVFKRPRANDSDPIGATEQGTPTPSLSLCIANLRARQVMESA